MKKKFVLTLALVLMVATTLVAFPVEFTGSIKAGYKLTFDPTAIAASNTPEINIDALSVSGDFWKVGVAGGTLAFDTDNAIAGTLSIYLDKALAEQGVDMGDVTVTLAIGNMGDVKPSDVYADTNDKVAELAMKGTYSSKVTVGYTDMVTVELAADPTNTADKPIMLGAKFAPVDGVKAAVGYTNFTASGDKGGMTASASADIAALAGLDFALTASAITVYNFDTEKNNLYAEVNGSFEDISAWAEYQLLDTTSNLIAKVTYAGIENMGIYGKLSLADFSDIATTIGFGADYTMGGVKYALDAEYAAATEAFSLTPSVKVSF
nr:hypothetical protein [uncultured Sphaerochaeta sp.]